jgi:hypothetical protein
MGKLSKVGQELKRNAAYRKGYDSGWHDIPSDWFDKSPVKDLQDVWEMGRADGMSDREDALEEHDL